jgi:hypothetical protein
MPYELDDETRQLINEALEGPLPEEGAGSPEFEAEIERRLAEAERIRLEAEQAQAKAAYDELIAGGVNEAIARLLSGYQPEG